MVDGPKFPPHPIQLADVASREAAQEGSRVGWCIDCATDGANYPTSTQHLGVVNPVAASQSGTGVLPSLARTRYTPAFGRMGLIEVTWDSYIVAFGVNDDEAVRGMGSQ